MAPVVRLHKQLVFSVPGPYDPTDTDPRVHTTKTDTFILRRKRGMLLLNVPDTGKTQPWPPHWELSSSLPPGINPMVRRNNDAKSGSFNHDVFSVVSVSNAARDKFLEMNLNDRGELSHYRVDQEESFGRISPALLHPSTISHFLSNCSRRQTIPGIMDGRLWS